MTILAFLLCGAETMSVIAEKIKILALLTVEHQQLRRQRRQLRRRAWISLVENTTLAQQEIIAPIRPTAGVVRMTK